MAQLIDCASRTAYTWLRPHQQLLFATIVSVHTANTIALAIGIVQLALLSIIATYTAFWHFTNLSHISYGTPQAGLSVVVYMTPGTLLLATLFAFSAWPLALVLACTSLARGARRTGQWAHAPPYYTEISWLQTVVLCDVMNWFTSHETRAATAALMHTHDGRLPVELVRMVMDTAASLTLAGQLAFVEATLVRSVREMAAMDCKRWMGNMTLLTRFHPRRRDEDFVVFVYYDEGREDVWLAVFSKDLWLLSAFLVTYVGCVTLACIAKM
ncbi:hypothetical protein BC831DRAFT_441989 [Entophlyctis helioformis]|nr:hypothetical protein BC831DRAFT_441989 [Entophlyctis helioformis]